MYRSLISLALLTLLAGDGLRSMPLSPMVSEPQGISINPDDWQSLAEAVSARAGDFDGTVGYLIKDFKSGQVASVNSDLAFPSASLIKFPILCAAFQAVEEGRLFLSTPVTLERGD